MNKALSTTSCPFCKQDNLCAVNNAKGCWCQVTDVPKDLIQLVPEKHKNLSCICLSCIKRFNEDPSQFKQDYL